MASNATYGGRAYGMPRNLDTPNTSVPVKVPASKAAVVIKSLLSTGGATTGDANDVAERATRVTAVARREASMLGEGR